MHIEHEVVESGKFIKITFTFADRNISVDFVGVGDERRTHSGERMEMQLLGILLLFFHRLAWVVVFSYILERRSCPPGRWFYRHICY